jgi:hypothetical protein
MSTTSPRTIAKGQLYDLDLTGLTWRKATEWAAFRAGVIAGEL